MVEMCAYPALHNPLFDPDVVAFFTRALSQHQLAQSYLFLDGGTADTLGFSRALAKALFCDAGGCDQCETCYKIEHDIHPDVHVLSPEGPSGYLIDQAREVIAQAAQAPATAQQKLFIITDAHMLLGAPANALLKTVEEPPEHTHFIFLAAQAAHVLPTLVSRSQIVPFSAPSYMFLQDYLVGKTGASQAEAAIALKTFQNQQKALRFLSTPRLKEARTEFLRTLFLLETSSWYELLVKAEGLSDLAKACALDMLEPSQEDEIDEAFFSAKQMKEREAAKKRAEQAQVHIVASALLSIGESFFSDVLLAKTGASSVTNQDVQSELQLYAQKIQTDQVLSATHLIAEARKNLASRVNPQLVFEALLLGLKENICQK